MKKFFLCIWGFLSVFFINAQTVITYNGSGNYTLRERTDLRRYDNGKYIGLVSKEVTSFITPVSFNNGYEYEGSFFLQQNTMHANHEVGIGIKDSIPASFKIDKEGTLTMVEDNGYPSFRSFPTFSNKAIKTGDSWTGKAVRAVDPLNKGIVTKMPIYVQYQYVKDDVFNGEPVYLLSAQWATRYGMGSGTSYIDWGGDKDLEKATGSHKATIYVSKITGNALVVRDNVDETYIFTDGNVIQFKGTIALFTEYPPAIDRSKLLPALNRLCALTENQKSSAEPQNKSAESTKKSEVKTKSLKSDIKDINEGSSLIAEITDKESSALQTDQNNQAAQNSDLQNLTEPVTDQMPDTWSEAQKRQEKIARLTQKVTNYTENNKKEADNKVQIAVDETPAGIRLSIQNLQFKADSSELLEGETSRLDQIAQVLKTVPDAKLLVEGHTASTGKPEGEKKLSLERAYAIAEALVKRGINADNFICKGYGGTRPIADNKDSQGKARNRRVEITILD